MPYFLSERNIRIVEKMDDPECNTKALYKTYHRFSVVNAIVSGWNRIYRSYIKPQIAKTTGTFSLLDIGFGGGDIPIRLARWASNDGFDVSITAIDTDERAVQRIQQMSVPENVTFLHRSSSNLLNSSKCYDIVISNHLLHHLTGEQMQALLYEAKHLSTKQVLFNDIERNDWAYGLFNVMSRPLSIGSFIARDGLSSIKRSYTSKELRNQVPEDWRVERMFPFRLLLSYHHE